MTTGEASRGRWLRCPPCTELPHRPERCLGRDAGCCCRWCPGRWREIVSDARLYRADPMVAELLRVIEWREARRGQARGYRRWQPCCARPACGNRVGSKTFGRPRLYCSDACKKAVYRARKRAQRDAVPGVVVNEAGSAARSPTRATRAPGAGTAPPNLYLRTRDLGAPAARPIPPS